MQSGGSQQKGAGSEIGRDPPNLTIVCVIHTLYDFPNETESSAV